MNEREERNWQRICNKAREAIRRKRRCAEEEAFHPVKPVSERSAAEDHRDSLDAWLRQMELLSLPVWTKSDEKFLHSCNIEP